MLSKILLSFVFLSMLCGTRSVLIEKCFVKDSISCVQIQIYQAARNFFNKVSSDVSGVLNLSTILQNPTHKSANFDEKQDDTIIHAGSVEQRQILLERYFGDKLKNLWSKMSTSWNTIGILRYLVGFLSKDVVQDVGEARGPLQQHKHKQDSMTPVLIAVGVKVAALVALAYMNIATVASKALLSGVVALVISGVIAIKNFSETRTKGPMVMKSPYEMEMNPWNNPYAKFLSSNGINEEDGNGHGR